MMNRLALLLALATPAAAMGHDTWVQTNTNLVRTGDAVHIDLMLGNHGNEHRDFKLAGKLSLEGATLEVIGPDGSRYDLKDRLADTGYTPQEGYWTTRFEPAVAGPLHGGPPLRPGDELRPGAVHQERRRPSSWRARASTACPPTTPASTGRSGTTWSWSRWLTRSTPMGPGSPIKVRLLYKGKPLAGERVSFIPRGATLKPGLDERYERKTDEKGEAAFEPTEANYYLIAAHKTEPKEGGTLDGKAYEFTKYGATLTVYVPRVCPCCGG